MSPGPIFGQSKLLKPPASGLNRPLVGKGKAHDSSTPPSRHSKPYAPPFQTASSDKANCTALGGRYTRSASNLTSSSHCSLCWGRRFFIHTLWSGRLLSERCMFLPAGGYENGLVRHAGQLHCRFPRQRPSIAAEKTELYTTS